MSKHYRPWKIDEAQLLPPSVQDYVPKDHPSRFIVALVREHLDLSEIEASYASVLGQPAFHPALMTALLLNGYASGIASSRRIAKACRERADFMMIVAGDAPDFRTISDFRKRHLSALKGLFVQVLLLCEAAGLAKLGHVAFDGSKIRANASKHKAMSYGRMEARASELEAEVDTWLTAAEAADVAEDELHGRDKRGDEMPAWVADKKRRAAKIRAAQAELEAEAKAACEAKAKAAAEAEEKRQAEGRRKPGKPAAPPSSEPDPKAQKNFSPGLDPGSREPDHEVEGRLRAGLQRPDRGRCAGAGDRGVRCDAKRGRQRPAAGDGRRGGGQPRAEARAGVGGRGLLLGGQSCGVGGARDRRLCGDRPGQGCRCRCDRGGGCAGRCRRRVGANLRFDDGLCARGQGADAGRGHAHKDQVGRPRQPLPAAQAGGRAGVRADQAGARLPPEDLRAQVENVIEYRKEIDHALERIAAIEKHVGIERKIAA